MINRVLSEGSGLWEVITLGRKSRLYSFSPEELQEVLNNSTGYIDTLRNLGFGGNSTLYKLKRINTRV